MQPTNLSVHKADLDQGSLWKERKEAEQARCRLIMITCQDFIGHFSNMASKKKELWLELTQHSLANCIVYEFQLVVSLDASKCNVFVQDSHYQLIIVHVTKILTRRKERRKRFCFFDIELFHTLAILLQVLAIALPVVLARFKNTW